MMTTMGHDSDPLPGNHLLGPPVRQEVEDRHLHLGEEVWQEHVPLLGHLKQMKTNVELISVDVTSNDKQKG